MDQQLRSELIAYLSEFVTESRGETIRKVLDERTRHITVVLEDLYQPHNASAVLRSCDGFGIQDVHIIENRNSFDPSSQVSMGADQWITLHMHQEEDIDNTEACFRSLKEQGYTVIATSPHFNDCDLNDLDIDKPVALVFGTELEGITDRAAELADGFTKIPMVGFTESFNISVSAAICLYDLTTRLKDSSAKWQLSDEEKSELQLEWLKQSIKAGDQLIKRYLEERDES